MACSLLGRADFFDVYICLGGLGTVWGEAPFLEKKGGTALVTVLLVTWESFFWGSEWGDNPITGDYGWIC